MKSVQGTKHKLLECGEMEQRYKYTSKSVPSKGTMFAYDAKSYEAQEKQKDNNPSLPLEKVLSNIADLNAEVKECAVILQSGLCSEV